MENERISPEGVYQQRMAQFGAARDAYERRSRRAGNLNLLLFLAVLVCLGLAVWQGTALLYALAGALLLALIFMLAYLNRLNDRLRRYRTLYDINGEGLLRLRRAWNELPSPGLTLDTGHPQVVAPMSPDGRLPGGPGPALDLATAADLDLLGHASLEHLLGTPTTVGGQKTLRQWILSPAAPEVVGLRQGVIAELAPEIDFRDEVCLRGRLMGAAQAGYEKFIAWAESEPWLSRRPGLVWLTRLLPLLALGLGVAQGLGVPALPGLVVVLLANFALTAAYGRVVALQIEQVAARQSVFQAYGEMFALIGERTFQSPGLRRLQERLSASHVRADRQMRSLSRLMPLVDIRHWMFFFLIEVAALWSFHLLWLLERWQRRAGSSVRVWLEVLGEMEALIALATLHHDHPGWAFPGLAEEVVPGIVARDLAHPLLPPAEAVGNDVKVGPPGTFLLVTGSNMSGKSTLLRAIGVNTVLAQMGGPVCALELRLTPLTVASSMRVQDSLEQGVSSFMAELRRLKTVVDLADRPGERPVLYLLDEILQGTNTSERQIAARNIILHLVRSGAIGAVSTHDLTLAGSPEMAQVSVPVYFTEQFTRGPDGPTMTFDYRLRPGIATSTNALKLMELIGLGKV